jgi:hypothetical protein
MFFNFSHLCYPNLLDHLQKSPNTQKPPKTYHFLSPKHCSLMRLSCTWHKSIQDQASLDLYTFLQTSHSKFRAFEFQKWSWSFSLKFARCLHARVSSLTLGDKWDQMLERRVRVEVPRCWMSVVSFVSFKWLGMQTRATANNKKYLWGCFLSNCEWKFPTDFVINGICF